MSTKTSASSATSPVVTGTAASRSLRIPCARAGPWVGLNIHDPATNYSHDTLSPPIMVSPDDVIKVEAITYHLEHTLHPSETVATVHRGDHIVLKSHGNSRIVPVPFDVDSVDIPPWASVQMHCGQHDSTEDVPTSGAVQTRAFEWEIWRTPEGQEGYSLGTVGPGTEVIVGQGYDQQSVAIPPKWLQRQEATISGSSTQAQTHVA